MKIKNIALTAIAVAAAMPAIHATGETPSVAARGDRCPTGPTSADRSRRRFSINGCRMCQISAQHSRAGCPID
jgi:hypothetical protein